ncbi:hypothetical protein AXG93_3036s1020 [Marchantia polymorpha subsp. ruderalis]|uniref:Non-specific serine/threonine protein kinase n=1 Tax=Marchantia polymorpha subsp. ruderalis TaxID=1480154 RepID=A0A176W986_MARPO|nr:hypothetical protein AXG93_3036s1020 [Marchantia polymorpha subsp. ruderalis]
MQQLRSVEVRDYLNLQSSGELLNSLASVGARTEKILYSANVEKVKRKWFIPEKQVLLITNKAVYSLIGKALEIKHRSLLTSLQKIIIGKQGSTQQFLLFIAEGSDVYDLHFASANVTEIVRILHAAQRFANHTPTPFVMQEEKDLKKFRVNKTDASHMSLVTAFSESDEEVDLSSFEVLKVLGTGASSKVFLVRKKSTGKVYAMKTLLKEAVIANQQVERAKSERQILEALQHPYLVSLRYAFQTENKLFIVLDYLNGGELFFHLKESGRFDEDRTRFYAAEIILGIGHLHSLGIVYRDLKPENILLDNTGHVKITDFGLAKTIVVNSAASGIRESFVGTPEYIADIHLCRSSHEIDVFSSLQQPPFYDPDPNKIYKKTLFQAVEFPATFSPAAKHLLGQLLERNQDLRLGAGDRDAEEIKEHPFFASIDWAALYNREIPAPFVPNVKGPEDVGNFDPEFTSERIRESMIVTGDQKPQRVNDSRFAGFYYSPANLGDHPVANAECAPAAADLAA